MSVLVLLDAGPLGLATNPRGSEQSSHCKSWLRALLVAGVRVMVPEIADYEVRRELIRAGKLKGIARLDELATPIGYLPVDTAVLRQSAELWAQARNWGIQTADDKALDCDVILSAQAQLSAGASTTVLVATTNVGHLGRFVDARGWESIDGFDIKADEFIAEIRATQIEPSTEVWLIYHCIDENGQGLPPIRHPLEPTTQAQVDPPGRQGLAGELAAALHQGIICDNINSLVRHAPKKPIMLQGGPPFPIQIQGFSLEIIQPSV